MSLRASLSASVYGNPQLDASKGYDSVMKMVSNIRNVIFYMDEDRRKKLRSSFDLSDVGTQVALLRELEKNVSEKMAVEGMEKVFGKTDNGMHILGGAPKK